MGMSVALVSQKGGVGKTTLAANLAAAFADLNFRTLLVEIDPQGSLIQCFGIDRFDLHYGLYGCISDEKPVEDAVETGLMENLDLLPANVWSHEEESHFVDILQQSPGRLRDLLDPLRDRYDYFVLDCPPALGPLTRAALTAADRYLVPVQAEILNLATLGRLEHLAGEVRSILNPDLRREGFVVTMADTRTRHANAVIESLRETHPDELFRTVVPRGIRVAEDTLKGRPTVLSRSRVGNALQALAEELLARHSRERAADAAMAEPEVETEDDPLEDEMSVDAWDRVLDELPDDDEPKQDPSRNGVVSVDSTGWDLDRSGWDLERS